MYESDPEYFPNGKKAPIKWHCKCDCGNEKDVKGSYLTSGVSRSCGCLASDAARERRRKHNHNRYDLQTYEYAVGYTNKNKEFYFDKEDYEKIKPYCWEINPCGYCCAKRFDGSGKHILMHQLIMNQKYIDHINGMRNDNRKSNLRLFDDKYNFNTYNQMNKKVQRNNTSGHPGICWHKRDQIWESYISVNRKRIYIGQFKNYDDALDARIEAEEKYFGENSYMNSQEYALANNLL